jgi:hypothetical protein
MSYKPQDARFVNAHIRALLAVALLLGCGALHLIMLALLLMRLWRAGPFGVSASDTMDGGTGELVMGFVGLAQIAVFISTAVVFLIWLHRAYKNLRAFGVKTETSPGWAVGYWFIPFANLVRPYQAVKELWIKSDPAVDFTHGFAKRLEGALATTPVGVWWFFWIVGGVVGRAGNRFDDSDFVAQKPEVAIWLGEATSIILLVAALLAAWVVWTIDQMQSEKSLRLGLSQWPVPPPPPADFHGAQSDLRT